MTVISFLFFLALTIVTLIGVGIGTGIFKLNAVAGMVISIILALIGFDFLLALMVLFFLAFCYLFYIMPVITLEDKGAWATIVYAYHKFRKNMGFWAKNGILTFLVIILAEIPYFIYLFSISGFIAPPTSLSQILISQLTTFPVVILGLAVQIAYCF